MPGLHSKPTLTMHCPRCLCPLQAWPAPQLPPSYYAEPWHWWNQPQHWGHGPFDLLTPARADRLAAAGAATPVCDALGDAVTLAAANLSRQAQRWSAGVVPRKSIPPHHGL